MTDDVVLQARRELAQDVVQFVTRWPTWRREFSEAAAYKAVMTALGENPKLGKFELAKLAIRAADPRS